MKKLLWALAFLGIGAVSYAGSTRIIKTDQIKGMSTLTIYNKNQPLALPTITATLVGDSTVNTLTNKSIDGLTNTITNVAGSTVTYPIARSAIAAGNANSVVINDGSGLLSQVAALGSTRGGSGESNAGNFTWGPSTYVFSSSGAVSVTYPTSGTLATLAGTESFTNKTLAAPILSTSAVLTHTTTPTNPASGNIAIYAKSDNELYKLNSAGSETQIATLDDITTSLGVDNAVVGSPQQVSGGTATYSSITNAMASVAAGSTIYILPGNYNESPSITKQLNIRGAGYGTYITGTVTLSGSATGAQLADMSIGGSLFINNGVSSIFASPIWFRSTSSFNDENTSTVNYLQGFTP